MSNEQAEDLSKHLLQLLSEIEYFVNLVDEHELKDKNVLKYYRAKVADVAQYSRRIFESIKPRRQKNLGDDPTSQYYKLHQGDLSNIPQGYLNYIFNSPYVGGTEYEVLMTLMEIVPSAVAGGSISPSQPSR